MGAMAPFGPPLGCGTVDSKLFDYIFGFFMKFQPQQPFLSRAGTSKGSKMKFEVDDVPIGDIPVQGKFSFLKGQQIV